MKPDNKFTGQNFGFWAVVKLASEKAGYSLRKSKTIPVAKVKGLTSIEI